MAQVPFDRFSDASAKCLLGFPSELSAQLRRDDCISTIMARTICHELDQGCMWSKARIGQDLIHCLADRRHDLNVRLLTRAPHILGLATSSRKQKQRQLRTLVSQG